MTTPFQKLFAVLSLIVGFAMCSDQAFAQVITVPNVGTKTLSGTDGDYQLNPSNAAYVSQLGNAGGSLPSLSVDLNNGLGTNLQTSPGWAFSGAQGNTWIANVDLGDPKVAYSIAFQNTTSSTETYNVSFSVPISPAESFNPADVRATVSGSLLNGGNNPLVNAMLTPLLGSTTGGPGTFLQTSTLTFATGGTASTNVDLTTGTVTAPGDGGNTIFSVSTPGDNLFNANGPTGTFDALTVNLSFSLTAGDFVSFTGRVDAIPDALTSVVPEPSSVLLSLFGLGFIALVVYRRRLQKL